MGVADGYPDKKLDIDVNDMVAVNVSENGKLVGVFQVRPFRFGGQMYLGVMGAQFMTDEQHEKWKVEHADELKAIQNLDQSGEGWKDGTPPA